MARFCLSIYGYRLSLAPLKSACAIMTNITIIVKIKRQLMFGVVLSLSGE
jgi:hypothetical protein